MDRSQKNTDTAVYVPGQTIGHHGGGATIWATVIVELLNADAEREENPTGVSAYVMRLTTETIANWSSGTTYALDAKAKDATSGRAYKSLQADNTNHALTSATWWELLPEISPLAMGWEAITDMRQFLQRYKVGAVVQLFKRTVGGVEKYYIPGMVYIGSDGSLATHDDGRAMAVYAG
jgi:hypothetical protein